jgi:hypothetical protein
VGSDGMGHAVWLTDEAGDRVQYCRVPAGGSGCDGESTLLSFPSGGAANAGEDAQVFTPAAGKVVILASCWNCGAGGVADRVWRWISTNNGVDFGAPTEVGDLQLNGQAAYLNTGDIGLTTEGTLFQATPTSAMPLDLGGTGLFVYSPSVALVAGAKKALYAVNDLDSVKYALFEDADADPISAGELNTVGNWTTGLTLPAPEGDNDETHLSSGPVGTFLTYRYFVPNDNRIALRRFDPIAETFGGPTNIEGPNSIDNNSADYPHHSQDAGGRLHAVWRSLYGGGRLRYTRSDDGGVNWTAVSNLAAGESFIDPIVEAGPAGTGFAIWGHGGGGATTVRIVPIDPQFEPDPSGGGGGPGPGGPDTTRPTASGFGIDDATLTPGARATFTFTSSEAGRAVLTFRKRVKGQRVKRRGKRRCVPRSKRRLRSVPRRRRCKTWKKVGEIRQDVLAGRNEIVFGGRIAGRRLRPGLYQARLVITDAAGNVSRTETIRFRVRRRG